MRKRKYIKLVHEGNDITEIVLELTDTDEGWSHYLSFEDVYRLVNVREALRRGELKSATAIGKIFTLTPISV